ncbi:PERF protein, partial [Bucco capensis]|nr:PERF protein [Bucco capensis]
PCRCGCAADAAVTSECCSRRRGLARLTLRRLAGEGWRGDTFTASDIYIRVTYAGPAHGRPQVEGRTTTCWNNQRPRWGAPLELGVLDLVPEASCLRLEVWDEDRGWDDDLLGTCEVTLEATGGGERRVVCFPAGGTLEFTYQLTCGPALGGAFCQDYVPRAPEEVPKWPPG